MEHTGHQLLSYRYIVHNRDIEEIGAASCPPPMSESSLDSRELNDAEAKIESHLLANFTLGVLAILFVF